MLDLKVPSDVEAFPWTSVRQLHSTAWKETSNGLPMTQAGQVLIPKISWLALPKRRGLHRRPCAKWQKNSWSSPSVVICCHVDQLWIQFVAGSPLLLTFYKLPHTRKQTFILQSAGALFGVLASMPMASATSEWTKALARDGPNQEKVVGTGNDMSSVSWNADASWTESTLLRYTHYTHQVHDKWGAATLKMGMNPIEKQSEALLQAAVGSNAKRTIYQLAGLHTLLVHLLLQWKKPDPKPSSIQRIKQLIIQHLANLTHTYIWYAC